MKMPQLHITTKNVDEILQLHKEVVEICDLAIKSALKGKLPRSSILFLIKIRLNVVRNRKKIEEIKKKCCRLENEGKLFFVDGVFPAILKDLEESLEIAKKKLENP